MLQLSSDDIFAWSQLSTEYESSGTAAPTRAGSAAGDTFGERPAKSGASCIQDRSTSLVLLYTYKKARPE